MVGISSLADSSTGEEAAASGIGRYFRSGRRLGRACAGFGVAVIGHIEPFGRRGIEDTVGQRSERGLERRQYLLPGTDAGVAATLERIDFGLDLRTGFVGSAPEFAEEARDLASDLRHFLRAKKD